MLVALAMLTLPAGAATTSSDVFDKPLDKLVVKLPADHDNLQAKPNRSCSYYSGFMVKEVDLGEVGADELSITPIAKGGPKPSCEAKTAGEIIIKADDWSGYFEGAKGDFVFFTAGDGVNGGMPYAVYSAKTEQEIVRGFREHRTFPFYPIVEQRDDSSLHAGVSRPLFALCRCDGLLGEDQGCDVDIARRCTRLQK